MLVATDCGQDRQRNDRERQERWVDVAEVVPDPVHVLVGRAPVKDGVTRVEEDPQVRRHHPARDGPQRRVVVQMRADLRRQDDHDCASRARERDQGDSAGPTLHARTLAAAGDASPMRHAGGVPWISCEHWLSFSLRPFLSLSRPPPVPPLPAPRFGSRTGKTLQTPPRAGPGHCAAIRHAGRSPARRAHAHGSPRAGRSCSHRSRRTSSAPRSTAGHRRREWSAWSTASACGRPSPGRTAARSAAGSASRRGSCLRAASRANDQPRYHRRP